MTSLPEDIRNQISNIITRAGFTSTELHDNLLEAFSQLLIRRNREFRRDILLLGRQFLEAAKLEQQDYGGATAAYAAEETCRHIANKILKQNIYVNTARVQAVEEFIQNFNEEGME